MCNQICCNATSYARANGIAEGSTYESEFGISPLVEATAVYNNETDEIIVFALNCNQEEETEFEIQLNGFGERKISKHLTLTGDNLEARNTFENPDCVTMIEKNVTENKNTKVLLPKLSWNVLFLQK
ncbi:alpha-L-arabinofuranosidase C-terminal domain-containing protein [Neobacillus niacini]|uniref:alpha-L-arabinofuranosidase C-terminal domain-containing protein n=1 Tax=Neobacillus niacini TaxID=86668 RepID=UPI003B02C200